jgi:hypothetical protein
MQYEISDPAAVAFARGFYAAIARGRGVGDAVSSGRVAILWLSDRTLEWVTPVLYLRGHDALLFTFPAPAEDRNREGTGSVRVGQPGDTVSPAAAGGGPRGDDNRAGVEVRPGQAARQQQAILADAVRVAQSISGESSKASTLASIAQLVAATDPGRAEDIARSITYDFAAVTLVRTARAMAAADPARTS